MSLRLWLMWGNTMQGVQPLLGQHEFTHCWLKWSFIITTYMFFAGHHH
jgi:hypothetical protein